MSLLLWQKACDWSLHQTSRLIMAGWIDNPEIWSYSLEMQPDSAFSVRLSGWQSSSDASFPLSQANHSRADRWPFSVFWSIEGLMKVAMNSNQLAFKYGSATEQLDSLNPQLLHLRHGGNSVPCRETFLEMIEWQNLPQGLGSGRNAWTLSLKPQRKCFLVSYKLQ